MGGSKQWFIYHCVCLPRSWPSLDIHRDLTYNELTTLPEGIFGGLTALEYL